MTWSFSRASCYQQCPYSFYLTYLCQSDDLVNESNYYAEVGIFIHEILKKVLSGEMAIEDAPQYYIDHFDSYVFHKTAENAMRSTYYKCLEYLAEVDFNWLKNYEIVAVETESVIPLGEKDTHQFKGIIDLLLRDKDGEYIVVDHKSSEYPFKKNGDVKAKLKDKFLSYKRQLYLYSSIVYQKYGKFPKQLMWNHFKDGGKLAVIDFNVEEYKEAVEWLFSVIEEAKRDETFDARLEYFYCRVLCGYRSFCEYLSADREESEV